MSSVDYKNGIESGIGIADSITNIDNSKSDVVSQLNRENLDSHRQNIIVSDQMSFVESQLGKKAVKGVSEMRHNDKSKFNPHQSHWSKTGERSAQSTLILDYNINASTLAQT